jgi:soluble lytic murein transglycosylase-like protein
LLSWQAAEAGGGKAQQGHDNPYKLQLKNAGDYRLNGSMAASSTVPAELAAMPYAREIEKAARASRLDPVLIHALIHVESRHQKDAVSSKGAVGLMQVLPATAQRFGVSQPAAVDSNLKAGTQYLRALLDRFDQRLDLALAAYNAGEGVVERYQGIPPYAETQAYVPAVLGSYSHWRKGQHVRYADGARTDSKSADSALMMR